MCIRDSYETRPEIATLYNTLWAQASQYAMEYLKDDELSYYYDVKMCIRDSPDTGAAG